MVMFLSFGSVFFSDVCILHVLVFFFSSRRRHTRCLSDWSSDVCSSDLEVANRAFGHSKENGVFKETDQSATSATLGDGGIYSNLEDLAKWDDALGNHALLSDKEMQPALTPVKLNDGSEPHWPKEPNGDNLHPGKVVCYGFGWFLDPYNRHPRMWHTGSTQGFPTGVERFLGENLTIIILSNRTDLDPEKLSLEVADLFLPAKN